MVILASGLVDLLPLVPLTHGEMEPVLSQTVEAIRQRVELNETCQELLGVTALLATLRYEREQVRAFFRRRATMSLLTATPLFEVLFEEVMGDRLRQEIQKEIQKEVQKEVQKARVEAEQKAEQVRLEIQCRADRLAAQLRALGVDPDAVNLGSDSD